MSHRNPSEGTEIQAEEASGESRPESRIDRRRLLAAAGVATAGAVVGAPLAAAADRATPGRRRPARFDRETDVIVVGSGGAAYSAALNANRRGASVVMLEKATQAGGTTAKSGGVYWIPNNQFMRQQGLKDERLDAIRYMVRTSFPTLYDPDAPRFGIQKLDYDLIAAYYDNGARAIAELARIGALQSTNDRGLVKSFPDYYAHLPEDKAPLGRHLVPLTPDRQGGAGVELIRQMKAAADKRRIPLLLAHRVISVVTNDQGHVIGVEAMRGKRTVSVRARKAVIFGTGGFTHNQEMALHYLRGPIFGGCGVPTNTGDFVEIGIELGAALGNMNNAWWAQIVLEQALAFSSTPSDVFGVPGDSMIQVNRFGRRVMNEKMVYNERTQTHFVWDPVAGEYPNLVTFMIYDQRVADGAAGAYPLPAKGATAPYVISGSNLGELAQRIDGRLAQLAGRRGVDSRVLRAFRLDPGFASSLQETVSRFNTFAESGKDLDFKRGEAPIDKFFNAILGGQGLQNDKPNTTMYPISSSGPYYCILLAPGTLDTKGGPRINPKAQVLDTAGRTIPGLYGAGNCIASPASQAYWSGGGTIGPGLVFGYIAAVNAVKERVKA